MVGQWQAGRLPYADTGAERGDKPRRGVRVGHARYRVAYPRVPFEIEAREAGGDVRVVSRRRGGVDLEEPDITARLLVHQLDALPGAGGQLGEVGRVVPLGDLPADHFDQQLAFRAEMPVEGTLGQLRRGGDVVHRHGTVATLNEQAGGEGHEAPARPGGLRGSRRWWRHERPAADGRRD